MEEPLRKAGYQALMSLFGTALMLSCSSCCPPVEPLHGVAEPTTATELEYVRAVVERTPTLYGYIQLSLWHFRAGEFRECVGSGRMALKIDPNNALAYNNICSAHVQLEEFDQAIRACEQALAIDPDFELAKNNLQWSRIRAK